MSYQDLTLAIRDLASRVDLSVAAALAIASANLNPVQSAALVGSGPSVVDKIDAERMALAKRMATADGVFTAMLDDDNRADALGAYLHARDDLLAMHRAIENGMIDADDSAEAIRHLRKALAKARQVANDAGADTSESNSVLQESIFSRFQSRASDAIDLGKGALGFAAGQLAGVGQGLAGLAASTPLGGGLFGIMMHGYKEGDRLKAETGEMLNLFVAAGESATNPQIARMAAFGERAQRYLGISRKDIQGAFKTYVDAGISMTEILATEDKKLGEVGASAVHMSVGLDKHFEWSGGTTAKHAAKAVREYGMSLHDSLQSIEKVAFAAREAGFGSEEFVAWSFTATANVRKLGVHFEDAALLALERQRALRGQGLNATTSSNLAQDGVEELYAGLNKRSIGEQVYMAGEMGYGADLAGRYELLNGLGDSSRQMKLIETIYAEAKKAGGGSEAHERNFLEAKGYGFEGARTAVAIGRSIEARAELGEVDAEQKEQLLNAFRTEGMKTSDIEKSKKLMLEGMAESGRALIALIANFAAIAIVGMISLPVLIAGDPALKERTYAKLLEYQTAAGKAWDSTMAGAVKASEGVHQIFGPIVAPISKALAFKPGQRGASGLEVAPTPTEEHQRDVLDDVMKRFTGRAMTFADEALITGITGMSKQEIERLSGTQAGQEQLMAAVIAARGRLKPMVNAVKGAGFKPGGSMPGSVVPGGDTAPAIGVGSLRLGPSGPNPMTDDEPPPPGVPALGKPGPGPTGALVPHRWDVPPGYTGPLVVDVTVSYG
jgi:hypothetical protein